MANMIVISGYLAKDPDVRTTQSGVLVASLRVAVRRKFAKDNSKHEGVRIVAERVSFCLGDKPRDGQQAPAAAEDEPF